MLVLTRKVGENIVVNDDIVITVLNVKNGRVKLGIDAPSGVAIRRTEAKPMAQTVQEENSKHRPAKLVDDEPTCDMARWLDACCDHWGPK